MKQYLWLVLALSIMVIGTFAGRYLGLSLATTVTIAAVPGFLVAFPFIHGWNPKISFGAWLFVAVISAVAGWALYLGALRLGF
jgi:hypothetical protein